MIRIGLMIGMFIVLTACQSTKSDQIPVIDLQSYKQGQKLKLSDLCLDLHLVPLETTPASLLPGHFQYWFGKQYCVIFTKETLLQFSTTGKFIRVLAEEGRAPGEFEKVTAFTVNEKTGHLYYTEDNRPDHISVVDLNTGIPLPDIEMKNAVTSYLYMPDEESVCGIGLEMTYTPYFYYKVSTSGIVQDTILKAADLRGGTCMGSYNAYMRKIGGEIHFRNTLSDTLYTLTEGKASPFCTWKFKKNIKNEGEVYKGKSINVLWETNDLLFLVRNNQEIKVQNNSVLVATNEETGFVVNKNNFNVRRLLEFYIDPLGESYQFCPAFHVCDQTVSFKLPVLELLEKYAQHPEQLSPEIRTLCEHLTEDSNPLLIVATLK